MAEPSEEDIAALEVHVCGPEDRAEQANLFNRCFKKKIEGTDLAWRYDDNPHGRATTLVYRPPGGAAVCSFAYTPRTVFAYGDPESEGQIGQQGDVMTDPEWQRRGLVMSMWPNCARETLARGWPINWGFPNRQSASVFLKLGWKSVGDLRPCDFYFNAGGTARRVRFREGRLPALLLPLTRLRCSRGRSQLHRQAGSSSYEVRPLTSFPDEVGEISKAVEKRFCFMARRDAPYLNWRFLNNPSKAHRSFGVFGEDGLLKGYVVIQPPKGDSPVGYVVDLLADEEWAVSAVLLAGLDELEKTGALVARATAVEDSWWEELLRESGFLSPKSENRHYVYVYIQDDFHPLAGYALDACKWYLTDGDRDDEMMG